MHPFRVVCQCEEEPVIEEREKEIEKTSCGRRRMMQICKSLDERCSKQLTMKRGVEGHVLAMLDVALKSRRREMVERCWKELRDQC